ncbi:cytoplasmic protein, partial [Salmonella enterica]
MSVFNLVYRDTNEMAGKWNVLSL